MYTYIFERVSEVSYPFAIQIRIFRESFPLKNELSGQIIVAVNY